MTRIRAWWGAIAAAGLAPIAVVLTFTPATALGAVDSDFDTLPDAWEVLTGRNPLVADYVVSAGQHHTCALDDMGVVCWGRNDYGQTDVPGLVDPMQVSAGHVHN